MKTGTQETTVEGQELLASEPCDHVAARRVGHA